MSLLGAFHIGGWVGKVFKGAEDVVKDVAHDVTHPQDAIKTFVGGVNKIGHGIDDFAHGRFREGFGEMAGGVKNVLDPAHLVGTAHKFTRPVLNPVNDVLAKTIKTVTGHNVLGSHPLNTIGTVAGSIATGGALGALGAGASLGEAAAAGLGSLESAGASALSAVGSGLTSVGATTAGEAVTGWGSTLAQMAADNAYTAAAGAASSAGSAVSKAQNAAFTPGSASGGGFNASMLTKEGAQAAQAANLGDGLANTSGLLSMGQTGMAGGGMYGPAGVLGEAGTGFSSSLLNASNAQAAMQGGGYYGSALTNGGAFGPLGSAGFKGAMQAFQNEQSPSQKIKSPSQKQQQPTGAQGQGQNGGNQISRASMGMSDDSMNLDAADAYKPTSFKTQDLTIDNSELDIQQFKGSNDTNPVVNDFAPVTFTNF